MNPTLEEIAAWANAPDALAPVEDWDLIITDEHSAGTILDLAADPLNPKCDFFLGCLYLFVGDAFRSEFRAHSRASVVELLEKVGAGAPAYLQRWRERSEHLLSRRAEFNYELWCSHGFAAEERARAS